MKGTKLKALANIEDGREREVVKTDLEKQQRKQAYWNKKKDHRDSNRLKNVQTVVRVKNIDVRGLTLDELTEMYEEGEL